MQHIDLDIEGITKEQVIKYQEILAILINSGSLDLKNGKAILNFNKEGTFVGVQLDYWAYKRKVVDNK